jgi:hypothetical protein
MLLLELIVTQCCHAYGAARGAAAVRMLLPQLLVVLVLLARVLVLVVLLGLWCWCCHGSPLTQCPHTHTLRTLPVCECSALK